MVVFYAAVNSLSECLTKRKWFCKRVQKVMSILCVCLPTTREKKTKQCLVSFSLVVGGAF